MQTDSPRPPKAFAKRILIADDNEAAVHILRRVFEEMGHTVHHVDNADDVLPCVEKMAPDLLLLDVVMPSARNLDGFAICRTVKGAPKHAAMPVILMTGIASGMQGTEAQMCQESGADACLLKPFSASHLLEKLRPFL